ncbi:hypothetical protein [Gilvibacter sediminis]|uniref:hypothetical protein n=1 Tax=Gilvibacter sediminis TaxID=379071 RepID=UPI002350DF5C|nr:hypothetical protein [Gilvibacter sediminis]MDC7998290.1 hypothetical protein [Gilvibacter sediminis]
MSEQLYQSLSWIPEYATGIWISLSAILVFTLLKVGKRQVVGSPLFKLGLLVLIVIWLYPAVTPYFYPIESGFIVTVITFVLSIYYYKSLAKQTPRLQLWLWPQLLWLVLVMLYTLVVLLNKYSA